MAGWSFVELDIVSALARTGDPTSGDHHGYCSALARHRGRLARRQSHRAARRRLQASPDRAQVCRAHHFQLRCSGDALRTLGMHAATASGQRPIGLCLHCPRSRPTKRSRSWSDRSTTPAARCGGRVPSCAALSILGFAALKSPNSAWTTSTGTRARGHDHAAPHKGAPCRHPAAARGHRRGHRPVLGANVPKDIQPRHLRAQRGHARRPHRSGPHPHHHPPGLRSNGTAGCRTASCMTDSRPGFCRSLSRSPPETART